MKLYIGIDPGLDGGVVALNQDGALLSSNIMPTRKLAKGRRVDAQYLEDLLTANFPYFVEDVRTILEDPGGHAPSAAGLRSMSMAFATAETILSLHATPYMIVHPRKWQAEFWSRTAGKKTDTKAAALDSARKLWPSQDWAPGRRTKPHDGLVDAALIAEWGRRRWP